MSNYLRLVRDFLLSGFLERQDWLPAAGFSEVAGYGEDGQPLTAEAAG
jgi:hypothetical protein